MKTTVLLLSLFCMIAFANTYSTGMGYPQDMFAEHLSVKKAPSTRSTKPVAKKIKKVCQKAQNATSCVPKKGTTASSTSTTNTTKKDSPNQVAKSAPMATDFQKVNIFTMKVFNLDGNEVEEKMISEEEWAEKSYLNQPFNSLIGIIGGNISSLFGR